METVITRVTPQLKGNEINFPCAYKLKRPASKLKRPARKLKRLAYNLLRRPAYKLRRRA